MTKPSVLPSDIPGHVLSVVGTGFFSRGSCSGCEWAMKGHADDVTGTFLTYHAGDVPLRIPVRLPLPPQVPEEPYVAALERDIIAQLATYIELGQPALLASATGLARARQLYAKEPGRLRPDQLAGFPDEYEQEFWEPSRYVALLVGRLTSMSPRQRQKIRLPTRTRMEMQRLLEGTEM